MKKIDNFEIYKWVYGIIRSCKHTFQLQVARVVIDQFDAVYNDETLTDELRIAWKIQYDEIHTILN